MGLDAYIQKDTVHKDGKVVSEQLWYGRKENEIHGWMQRQSGVSANEFNCVNLDLTAELLDLFELDAKSNALTPTAGYFFGAPGDKEQVNLAAKTLLQAARDALAEGKKPYYTSWW